MRQVFVISQHHHSNWYVHLDCVTDSLQVFEGEHLRSHEQTNEGSETVWLILRATKGYLEGAEFITAGNISWICITVDSGCDDEHMDNAFAFYCERCHVH